jgi:hypothetical protein
LRWTIPAQYSSLPARSLLADRDRLAFVANLALRAVQQDLEVVVAVDQRDLELVATVDAVALVAEQLSVAVQLGIPSERQRAAQRSSSRTGSAVRWACCR